MIKKRYIMIFLSVIFLNVILITNVKALNVNNFGVVANLPNFDTNNRYAIVYGSSVINNTYYSNKFFVLEIVNASNRAFYVYAGNNYKTQSNPNGIWNFNNCGGPASGCPGDYKIYYLNNNQWEYITTSDSFANQRDSNNNISTSVVSFIVYAGSDIKNSNSPYANIYTMGYTLEPEVQAPQFNVLHQGLTTINNREAYQYYFAVANYSSDYIYEYRYYDYLNSKYISPTWEQIEWTNNVPGIFDYITYDNVSIELRIRQNNDIIHQNLFVVVSFEEKNIYITNNGIRQIDNLFHLNYNYSVNCSDYNLLDYYFKISIDNGESYHTYFTNNTFNFNIQDNTSIIVEVYSLIDNNNQLINRLIYNVDMFLNGYDNYYWVEGFQYAFLSNLPNGGNIVFKKDTYDSINTKPIISFYNFNTKNVLDPITITNCNDSNLNDYYCFNFDNIYSLRQSNPNDTIGIIINTSNYSDLGIFCLPFLPNDIYLSYMNYNGAGEDIDNYFNNIDYIDNNGDKQTIIDEDLFSINISRYIDLFFEVMAQPILFLQKLFVYIFNSLNFYIKLLLLYIVIQSLCTGILKIIIRR